MRNALLVVGLAFSTPVLAAPGYEKLVMSDAKGGKPMKAFKPDTPRVVVYGGVRDPADGTLLRADWFAEKTDVAPPNYKIDSKELRANKGSREVNFSLVKPTAGWPVGSYRVELFVDGKVAEKFSFTVQK